MIYWGGNHDILVSVQIIYSTFYGLYFNCIGTWDGTLSVLIFTLSKLKLQVQLIFRTNGCIIHTFK